MKILVFAHQLEVGGTQVNAIELSAALRDLHGHQVVVFATPGPMVKVVRERSLRFLPAPDVRLHPSPTRMRALRDVVKQERPDVIHVWDWWQCLDAYYAVHLPMRVPMVVTDMCMGVTRMLPKSLPTTFGTPALVDAARASGRYPVELLLPPVDVSRNAPGVVDPRPFRKRYGINGGEILLVTISRFGESLKGESLRRTIHAIGTLGDLPLRLMLVGDGALRPELQRLADCTNARLGRAAVVLTGTLLDPRPAYAAADLVVGMGGSALRAMAFGKPVVIVGEKGFSAPFTPQTAESFYYKGIYGLGNGNRNDTRLAADIRGLAEQPDLLPALGEFSRQFVLKHFALEKGSARLSEFMQLAVRQPPKLHVAVADGIRTAAVWLRERRFLPGGKAFIPRPEDSTTAA